MNYQLRVGFLFLHPFSGSLGSTVRVKELSNHLCKLDVESYIFTPYEKTQVIDDRVTVVSIAGLHQKLGISDSLYKLIKFAYYNQFFVNHFMTSKIVQSFFAKNTASSIEKAFKSFSVEIIQVEQDFALPTAIELKKRTDLPLVVDLHNITSEELVASGAIKHGSSTYRKLQNTLKENLKMADTVVVVSDMMKDYVITNYGLPDNHVHVVPPGANWRGFHQKICPAHPKVVYSGLVAYREHVDLFIKSMPFIQQRVKDVEFYITDKGKDIKKIKKLAQQLHVKPIFFWYPKRRDLMNFISSCDVAVLPSTNDVARQMGIPVKLFDYLSVGLPVVANDIAAWTNMIEKETLGVVTVDDPESFAQGIINLLENDTLRAECSKNAERVATLCTWDNSAKTLKDVLTKFDSIV